MGGEDTPETVLYRCEECQDGNKKLRVEDNPDGHWDHKYVCEDCGNEYEGSLKDGEPIIQDLN